MLLRTEHRDMFLSGTRASVDGNGYDGIRGAGSGPILTKANVHT